MTSSASLIGPMTSVYTKRLMLKGRSRLAIPIPIRPKPTSPTVLLAKPIEFGDIELILIIHQQHI